MRHEAIGNRKFLCSKTEGLKLDMKNSRQKGRVWEGGWKFGADVPVFQSSGFKFQQNAK